jgi:hypothetical protein
MGEDYYNETAGYCQPGDDVIFKLYLSTKGEIVDLNGDIAKWESLLVTGIEKLYDDMSSALIPLTFNIGPAYPNPFNPETTFDYSIPANGRVNISVYDINGRIVDVLTDKNIDSGNHLVIWNGYNQPTGLYFIKVNYNQEIKTVKIMLVK